MKLVRQGAESENFQVGEDVESVISFVIFKNLRSKGKTRQGRSRPQRQKVGNNPTFVILRDKS
jgi:hypothetical protein